MQMEKDAMEKIRAEQIETMALSEGNARGEEFRKRKEQSCGVECNREMRR